jgi:hypothetical protein
MIAVVTYNALVRLAPIGARRPASARRVHPVGR